MTHRSHAGDVCPATLHLRFDASMTATLWQLLALLHLATRSDAFQRTPSSRAHTRLHASTTLTELLEALKPYAPVRCIVVLPGAAALSPPPSTAASW